MTTDVRSFDGLSWYSLKGPKGDPGTEGPRGPQGIQGPPGQIGIAGLIIDLDNEQHSVPVEYDGTGGDWSTAISTATIYKDGVDDSANWTWQFPILSEGVQGNPSNGNRTFHVTGITGHDVGTVSFTATSASGPLQSKVFTVFKVKGGANGEPATVYRLSASVAAVNKNILGAYTPPIVTFAGFSVTGNSPQIPYAGRFIIDRLDDVTSLWEFEVYKSPDDELTHDYTVPPNTRMFRCSLCLKGGYSVIVDGPENIPVTKDGLTGPPGSSGVTINLDNDNHSVAVNSDGTGGDWSTAICTASIFYGTTDVSTEWTFSPPTLAGGIRGTASNNNRTFKVDEMDFDSGTVTFSASKSGETISAIFTISKVRGGADGTPATIYWLRTAAGTVVKKKDGSLIPSPFIVETFQTAGDETSPYIGLVNCNKQVVKNGPWIFVGSQNLAICSFDISTHGDALAFKFELKHPVNGTIFDWEIVPLVSDGADGQPGPPGSGFVMSLDNDSHIIPTNSSGGNGNYTGAICTATLFNGGLELPVGPGADQVQYLAPVLLDLPVVTPFSVRTEVAPALEWTTSNDNRTATVTRINNDVARLQFSAVYDGVTYTSIWTITRLKSGAAATIYRLSVAENVIPRYPDGTFKLRYLNVQAQVLIATKPPAIATGMLITAYRRIVNQAFTSIGSSDTGSMLFDVTLYPDSVEYKFVLTDLDKRFEYDAEIIPVISDGQIGPQGIPGIQGPVGPVGPQGDAGPSIPGARGPGTFVDKVPKNLVDADFNREALIVIAAATGGGSQVIRDIVTLYDSVPLEGPVAYTYTRVWTGNTWLPVTQYLSGNLVLDGTLSLDALSANGINAKGISIGNFVGDNAAFIKSNGFLANIRGFQLDGAGNTEFQTIKARGDIITGTGNMIQNSDAKQEFSNTLFNDYGIVNCNPYVMNHTQDTKVPWYENVFVLAQSGATAQAGGNCIFTFCKDDDGNPYPTSPGKKYQVSAYMACVGCNVNFYVDFYNSAGTYVSSTPWITINNGTSGAGGGRNLETDYARRFINFEVPPGASGMKIVFSKLGSLTGFSQSLGGITRLFLMEVPAVITNAIPWSPGGVSLINTGALAPQASNALTIVESYDIFLAQNSTSYAYAASVSLPFPKGASKRSWAFIELSMDLVVTTSDNFVLNCALFNKRLLANDLIGIVSSQRITASGQTMNFPVYVKKLVDLSTLYESLYQDGSRIVELYWGFTGRGMAGIKEMKNIVTIVQEVKR